jgi:hypothetical protein
VLASAGREAETVCLKPSKLDFRLHHASGLHGATSLGLLAVKLKKITKLLAVER